MRELTDRQQRILYCLNAFLGETSRQNVVEDSVLIAKIAVDLASVAAEPDFDPSQIEALAIGFILQYTLAVEETSSGKRKAN